MAGYVKEKPKILMNEKRGCGQENESEITSKKIAKKDRKREQRGDSGCSFFTFISIPHDEAVRLTDSPQNRGCNVPVREVGPRGINRRADEAGVACSPSEDRGGGETRIIAKSKRLWDIKSAAGENLRRKQD